MALPRHAASCANPEAGLHVKLHAGYSRNTQAYKRPYLLQDGLGRCQSFCPMLTWHSCDVAYLACAGAALRRACHAPSTLPCGARCGHSAKAR